MDSTYSLWMQSVFSNVVHRLVKSQLEASSFASASKGLEAECYEWCVPKSGTEGQHTTVQKNPTPHNTCKSLSSNTKQDHKSLNKHHAAPEKEQQVETETSFYNCEINNPLMPSAPPLSPHHLLKQ